MPYRSTCTKRQMLLKKSPRARMRMPCPCHLGSHELPRSHRSPVDDALWRKIQLNERDDSFTASYPLKRYRRETSQQGRPRSHHAMCPRDAPVAQNGPVISANSMDQSTLRNRSRVTAGGMRPLASRCRRTRDASPKPMNLLENRGSVENLVLPPRCQESLRLAKELQQLHARLRHQPSRRACRRSCFLRVRLGACARFDKRLAKPTLHSCFDESRRYTLIA